jgi:anti-sigma regulatory factor (Ser/Thr protein kinase)
MPSRRVLMVASEPERLTALVHLLAASGIDVAHVQTAAAARSWLRIHRADLGIIDLADARERGARADLIREQKERTNGLDVVALVGELDDPLRRLIRERGLANFVGHRPGEAADPLELAVTVRKLVDDDIFGLDKYLAAGAETQRFDVRSYRERDQACDEVRAFCSRFGSHALVSDGLATAADEMVSNVLGHHKDRQEASLEIGCDGRRIAIATRDPHGDLDGETVLHYITACFDASTAPREGGLGLFTIFRLVQQFVINLEPGRATELVGVVDVTRSFQAFSRKAKSFNLFRRRWRD